MSVVLKQSCFWELGFVGNTHSVYLRGKGVLLMVNFSTTENYDRLVQVNISGIATPLAGPNWR